MRKKVETLTALIFLALAILIITGLIWRSGLEQAYDRQVLENVVRVAIANQSAIHTNKPYVDFYPSYWEVELNHYILKGTVVGLVPGEIKSINAWPNRLTYEVSYIQYRLAGKERVVVECFDFVRLTVTLEGRNFEVQPTNIQFEGNDMS